MKGLPGLAVAFALAVGAALLNWSYLARRSQDVEKIGFLGIVADADVGRGEPLRKEHLVRVDIPKRWAGNLEDFAIPYSAEGTVIGSRVWRRQIGGSLLLGQDLRTPPQELRISESERVVFVPVDTRTFVPSLVSPGDQVWFMTVKPQTGEPTPADVVSPASRRTPSSAPTHTIGPFEVLSVGNRLSSGEVFRAARVSQSQENVMGIRATATRDGALDGKTLELMQMLNDTDFRPVSIIWSPAGQAADL